MLAYKELDNLTPPRTFTPVRAVSYCRVSSEKQAATDKVSLGEQRRLAELEAERRGWLLGTDYVDSGVSGQAHAIAERKGLHNLMADAKAGRFGVVIVYNSDRIGRREDVFHSVVQPMFYDYRVPILDLSKPLQIDDPRDFDPTKDDSVTLNFGFAGIMASLDQRQRTRRTVAGQRKAAEEGRFLPNFAPYGYRFGVEQTTGGRTIGKAQKWLEPCPTEYPVLEMIVQMVLRENQSTLEVVKRLTEMGIKTRSGKPWRRSVIWNILRNPFHAGFIHYGQTVKTKDGKLVKRRHAHNVIKVAHNYPHILTMDDYEAITKSFKTRKERPARSHSAPNPLSGLLKCARCGSSVWLCHRSKTSTPEKAYYRCAIHHDNKYACTQPNTSAALVFNSVWQEVDIIARQIKATLVVGGIDPTIAGKKASLEGQLEQCRRDIATTDRRSEKLIDHLADGVISREDYAQTVARYAAEKAELSATIEDLEGQISELGAGEAAEVRSIEFTDAWQELSEYARDVPFWEWPADFMQEVKSCLQSMFKAIRLESDFNAVEAGRAASESSRARTLASLATTQNWTVKIDCEVI